MSDVLNHAREVRNRLRFPSNAKIDLGIDLKRKPITIECEQPEAIPVPVIFQEEPADIPYMMRSLRSMRAEIDRIAKQCTEILKTEARQQKVEDILRLVAEHYGCTRLDIVSARQTVIVVLPRHVAIYLCSHLTPCTLVGLGRIFGDRDHSTISYAIKKIKKTLATDTTLDASVTMLTEMLSV